VLADESIIDGKDCAGMTEHGHETRKIRIGVLFGGRSAEHDVSLRSAITIMDALDRTDSRSCPSALRARVSG
jgi:hypothetical protein